MDFTMAVVLSAIAGHIFGWVGVITVGLIAAFM